jgi:hypothetical protein
MGVGGSYALQVREGDVWHTVLVWNGVKDYRRVPSPDNVTAADTGGLMFGGKVTIAQIGRPVGHGRRSAIETLAVLFGSADSVILWARDTKTYESIRDELRMNATLRFDGSPLSKH